MVDDHSQRFAAGLVNTHPRVVHEVFDIASEPELSVLVEVEGANHSATYAAPLKFVCGNGIQSIMPVAWETFRL